ncbi:hypothetical protein BYT27DRAFT_7299003 [Phlegmacium glaucopus]|nr:hypothetical protein BYT27DRAFT_7299003 [Phlegmacium glaucopus]
MAADNDNLTKLENIEELQGEDVIIKSARLDLLWSLSLTIFLLYKPLQFGSGNITFVNTIGLGGSNEAHNTINLATKWINIFNPSHNSDNAGFNQDNQDNLEFFKSLIGNEILKSVTFVFTHWAGPGESARYAHCHDDHLEQWKKKLEVDFPGAHIICLHADMPQKPQPQLECMDNHALDAEKAKYKANVLDILNKLIRYPAAVPPLLQKDLQSEVQTNGETTLAHTVDKKVERIAKAAERGGNVKMAQEARDKVKAFNATNIFDEAGKAGREGFGGDLTGRV